MSELRIGELRIGDRVRTPVGNGVITRSADAGMMRVDCEGETYWWHKSDLALAEFPDIPRERVEALHAAVTARLEQLEASRAATWYASEKDIFAACHSDLSEVAEALRLLLEVDP